MAVDLPERATLATVTSAPPTESPRATCANCGAALVSVYCGDCGQHVADSHRSVWRFVADFLENTFCWDNKLLRTLKPLFRQPGYLTREFMAGRRARYVHPLRLFLFTSALCLTLLQFSHDYLAKTKTLREAFGGNERDFQWIASKQREAADTPSPVARAAISTVSNSDNGTHPETGDLRAGRPADDAQPDGWAARFDRALETRIARNGGEEQLNKAISDGVQRRLSWVVLALLPVFALGLRALYWRKDTFYFAHLVFSLHYHTFLLLFWTGYVGMGLVAVHVSFVWLPRLALKLGLLLPPLYLFAALRRMYDEGRGRTLGKMLVLGATHLLVILISLAVVGGMTFLFL